MNQDLKIIKKKYGEKMAHFCRDYFSTILETEGLLLKLLLDNFEPSHDLYDDIIKQLREIEFKNYIYNLVNVEDNNKERVIKTPKELLEDAGYDLYECKSEEDIQKFKKYYASGEELCTFNGGRLDRCYVFFAVKKNVSDIKRTNYPNPQRQDEYGTSVISIQFTKDKSHTLSIKNRYNHHVNNPDSTFSNNLDNITPGLTKSFGEYYGLVQQHVTNGFELRGYVKANDGKYYKYNQEINNIYYCPNNIIIDNFEVKRYDKEKYLIFDYFILDLVKKEIRLYDKNIKDSFPSTIINIQKIEIVKKEMNEKEIKITLQDNNNVIITLKDNKMLKLEYPDLEQIEDDFLIYNRHLKVLKMASLQKIGNYFLDNNGILEELELPNLQETGYCFLSHNMSLRELNLPLLEYVGGDFLAYNSSLEELSLPKLRKAGDCFLLGNEKIRKLDLPSLEIVGSYFLSNNLNLEKLNLPSLEWVVDGFLCDNELIEEVYLPKLKIICHYFLCSNKKLKKLWLPNLEIVGSSFLRTNNLITELSLPKLKTVSDYFMFENNSLRKLDLPVLEEIGNDFLANNSNLEYLNMPNVKINGNNFLKNNSQFTKKGLGKFMLNINDFLAKCFDEKENKKGR